MKTIIALVILAETQIVSVDKWQNGDMTITDSKGNVTHVWVKEEEKKEEDFPAPVFPPSWNKEEEKDKDNDFGSEYSWLDD